MIRRVVFGKTLEVSDDLVSEREMGGAPFALAVEFSGPEKGLYRMRTRVRLRDGDVAELIRRHQLSKIEIIVDRAATAIEKQKASLKKERTEILKGGSDPFVGIAKVVWCGMREAAAWVEGQRVVRITFGTLLDGIEVVGSMDEVRRIQRDVTLAVDRLAASIETGAAFDAGEIRVYAPGKKAKADKQTPRTPPSRWSK